MLGAIGRGNSSAALDILGSRWFMAKMSGRIFISYCREKSRWSGRSPKFFPRTLPIICQLSHPLPIDLKQIAVKAAGAAAALSDPL